MNENSTLKNFYILWGSQSLSQLGSSITAFALTLWLYQKTGSALSTAALTICSYAPYVLVSIFAGALTDRFDKKKTMLICDTFAALTTVIVFFLYRSNTLAIWHLYAINAVSGLMNTVQQPASEVAMSMIIPRKYYQKSSALRNLSRSTISILNPLVATAFFSCAGLDLCIAFDLVTFLIAFVALAGWIHFPETKKKEQDSVLAMAKEGFDFLRKTPMVFTILLFMAGVNLIASAFDATLPGYIIPNPKGGMEVLGIVTSVSGIAMVAGSLIASVMPKPKNRVKVIFVTMLFSLGTENFILTFSREPVLWCIGQFIGWILVPIMSTNLEVVLRNSIPLELQGRVYACRNTLQFFTIPIGLFLGGFMVDQVCEPFMADLARQSVFHMLFGSGKGSGAALVIFVLGVSGTMMCLLAGNALRKYTYMEDKCQDDK